MNSNFVDNQNKWDENLSRQFIDYGRYFVPEREYQMYVVSSLLGGLKPAASILELCCGEGLLAEIILDTYPEYSIRLFDGSQAMITRACRRLSRFNGRVRWELFDLPSLSWRFPDYAVDGVVSSLAIHHLNACQKQSLFRDIYRMLSNNGVFIIADVVDIHGRAGKNLAAEDWDRSVLERSVALDGNPHAFEFFTREGWNIHRGMDPDDFDKPSTLFDQLKWLEEAGFSDVEVSWARAGHAIFSGRKPVQGSEGVKR